METWVRNQIRAEFDAGPSRGLTGVQDLRVAGVTVPAHSRDLGQDSGQDSCPDSATPRKKEKKDGKAVTIWLGALRTGLDRHT